MFIIIIVYKLDLKLVGYIWFMGLQFEKYLANIFSQLTSLSCNNVYVIILSLKSMNMNAKIFGK